MTLEQAKELLLKIQQGVATPAEHAQAKQAMQVINTAVFLLPGGQNE